MFIDTVSKTVFIVTVCLLGLCLFGGCSSSRLHKLPAIGQVVYCKNCDSDLYIRRRGTSRTAFSRADYSQARFDVPIPRTGFEPYCPFCRTALCTFDTEGNVIQVFYRDRNFD